MHFPFCFFAGKVPSVRDGIVAATGCINQGRECCIAELPLQVKNCSSFVVYDLVPTPKCNMGYCAGDGLPCPEGMTSSTGFTPCTCT